MSVKIQRNCVLCTAIYYKIYLPSKIYIFV